MATPTTSRPTRIVVIAFGPTELTRDARRRAQRLVGDTGDVVVVAAHRGAASDTTMPIGTDGLRSVLEPSDAPVLLIHDDIVIGRDGVAAMMRAWHATGHPTVPWSSVPGTSHHVDEAIPRDDDARMRLTRQLPLRGGPATAVRPICMLGTSAGLRELTDRFLTVADTVWSDPQITVTVAAKALAHHGQQCAQAVAPATGPDGGPLLVAAMIVRNEAAVLSDCLASLSDLVDRIELCDTGSTDDTVAIAESFGANVLHRAWHNDFAWARNQVLERCQDAVYILQIDADERARYHDPDAIRQRLAVVADSVRILSVPIDNLDDIGHIASTHDAPRVLRPQGITYRGALHERPWSTDGATLLSLELKLLRLEHLGYQQRVVTERAKSDRNVAISERAYREAPNWETAFQYARSLSLAGHRDDDRVTELLRETLDAGDAVPVTWRAWSFAKLGRDALERNEDEEAIDLAQQALQLVPADPVAGAVLADAAQRLGRSDLILEQRTARRSTVSPKPFSQLAHARAQLAGAEISTLLEYGATDDAYDEAAAALRADPAHFTAWPALVRSVSGSSEIEAVDELLVSAALNDVSGECIAAITHGLDPERTARLCVQYLRRGGTSIEAIRNGFATALVARDPALVDQLLPDAHRLEPTILNHLAATASQRGMQPQSDNLAILSQLPRPNFVVCGAGRSGTGYTSKALTALGHPCGHENVFAPFTHTPEFGVLQGDSSWLALPYLDNLPTDAVIFHQVRDPLQVLRSLAGIHMLTAPSPYLDFIAEHAPEVIDQPDELSRCMAYWVVWNRRLTQHAEGVRPYVRYRLEDLMPEVFVEFVGLLGSLQPVDVVRQRLEAVPNGYNARRRDESVSLDSLPAGALRDELFALAEEYGYEPVPA